jgi:hypothetical protein
MTLRIIKNQIPLGTLRYYSIKLSLPEENHLADAVGFENSTQLHQSPIPELYQP